MTEEAAAPEAAPEAPDAAAPEGEAAPPAPDPGPSIEDVRGEYEAKIARHEAALRRAERTGVETKGKLSELQKQAEELQAWKGDKWAAAKALGITFEEMSRRVLDGADNPSPEDVARDQERAEVRQLKEELQAERKIREERDATAGFEDDVSIVEGMLPEGSLAAELGQARTIARLIHSEHQRTGEVPDVEEMIQIHEKMTTDSFVAQLKSKAGQRLLSADPELKAAILTALNGTADGDAGTGEANKQDSQQPEANEGEAIKHRVEDIARNVTNSTSAETGGRGQEPEGDLDEAARDARALAAWREIKERRRAKSA